MKGETPTIKETQFMSGSVPSNIIFLSLTSCQYPLHTKEATPFYYSLFLTLEDLWELKACIDLMPRRELLS